MDYHDSLETRDPAQREREQLAALPRQIGNALGTPYFARVLAGIDPAGVTDRAALARLPVTRKSDLTDLQKAAPPFAGMVPPAAALSRIFASPGPTLGGGSATRSWRSRGSRRRR